jgi:hypothetical protein
MERFTVRWRDRLTHVHALSGQEDAREGLHPFQSIGKTKILFQRVAPVEQGFSDEELIREIPKSTEGSLIRFVAARKGASRDWLV